MDCWLKHSLKHAGSMILEGRMRRTYFACYVVIAFALTAFLLIILIPCFRYTIMYICHVNYTIFSCRLVYNLVKFVILCGVCIIQWAVTPKTWIFIDASKIFWIFFAWGFFEFSLVLWLIKNSQLSCFLDWIEIFINCWRIMLSFSRIGFLEGLLHILLHF